MLLPNNEYLRRDLINETIALYRHEAEVDRWIAEICPQDPSQRADQAYKALQRLGHTFLTWGHRLNIQPRKARTHLTSG